MPSVAQLHLYKSMLRSKQMSTAPAFPSYITAKIEAAPRSQDIASCNVQARLFNSQAVKTAVAEIMSGVGLLLGIPNGALLGKKARLRASDIGGRGDLTKSDSTGAREVNEDCIVRERNMPQITTLPETHATDQKENVLLSDEEIVDNYEAFASRLGNSSDDESTEEREAQNILTEGLTADHELSRTSSFSSSSSLPNPLISARLNSNKQHISTKVPKSTTFIPSLTLGGYISDSHSDHSQTSRIGSMAPEPRKNRRGQQARRQIWEKKYGQNAKHLQRQARNPDRDHGWDPKAGARPADVRGKGGSWRGSESKRGRGSERGRGRESGRGRDRGPTRSGKAGPLSSGANADPVEPRPTKGERKEKKAEGPLHPSWEAAKKAKEATKKTVFQGKKLVF